MSLSASFAVAPTRARAVQSRNRTHSVRVTAAHQPGVIMPEGPDDALNKWSRKITQPKSQGASQVRARDARETRDVSVSEGCFVID